MIKIQDSDRNNSNQDNENMNNEPSTADVPRNWREMLTALEKERDGLQKQIAQLRSERDQLTRALVELLREEVTLSEQEILAQLGQEKPLREFLGELRAELVEN
jgi:uncharacterized coiled-coil DUF342 family protein